MGLALLVVRIEGFGAHAHAARCAASLAEPERLPGPGSFMETKAPPARPGAVERRCLLLHSRKLAPLAAPQTERIAAANRFIRFSDASALPVRQLRVSVAHPGRLYGFREISVFE